MKVRYKFNEISTELTHVHLTRTDDWVKARLGSLCDFSLANPVECETEFYRDSKSVHLKGTLETKVLLVCVKCLEEFNFSIKKDFAGMYFESPSFNAMVEEIELDEDTINEEYLIDGIFDLEDIMMEELLLSIPDYPRCNEDCKGLCPHCGKNLNHEQCDCSQKDIDNPFYGLKNLSDS